MKPGAILLICIFLLQFSYGQNIPKKQTIKVYGNCGQCKNKIEKSAISAGAGYASWNKKTKKLNIRYDPSVINPVDIERAIANAGYDTQDIKASDSAYNELEKCCQYHRIQSITSKIN